MTQEKIIHIITNAGRLANLLPDEVEKLLTLCGKKVKIQPLEDWWNHGQLCTECHKINSANIKTSQTHYVKE